MRFIFWGLVFFAVLAVLSACGGQPPPATPTAPVFERTATEIVRESSVTPSPTLTLLPASNTPTPSITATNTVTDTPTDTPTGTTTPSPTPTITPTNTVSDTPSSTPTGTTTPSQTPTITPTSSATASLPPLPTRTPPPPAATITLPPPATITPQADGGIVILSTAQLPDFNRLTPVVQQPPGVPDGPPQNPQNLPPPAVPPEVALAAVPPPANTFFEEAAYLQGGFVEIAVPIGWEAWWETGIVQCDIYRELPTTGPCPTLAEPDLRYYRPEFDVINPGSMLRGIRIFDGAQSVRFFCTYGVCIGGLLQQVPVVPGARYAFGGFAFSWCTTDPEFHQDVLHSTLVTRDDQLNCEVALGLDPDGGTDWKSPSIEWVAMNHYDIYQYFETPLVTATGSTMTLFIRGRSLWGFHHIDFHFDGLVFEPR